MKEFISPLGWKFVSKCGCIPPLDEYANDKYPGYQIRLGTGHFAIRLKKNNAMWNQIASGMANNLEQVYSQYFQ